MKSLHKSIVALMCMLCFVACNSDEFGDRKESTPVIESAALTPASFNFGDTVTLSAQISDPATQLTSLLYEVVSNNQVLLTGAIPLSGSETKVSQKIIIPLLSNQADNAPVTIKLSAINVLHGAAGSEISGLTGKCKSYSQLYLLTTDGNIVTLTQQVANKDKYEAKGLALSNTFSYRIVERITANQEIDYTGAVWGNKDGKITTIDSKGEVIFAHIANSDYIQSLVFDRKTFAIDFIGDNGSTLKSNDIWLNTNESINDEECKKGTLQLEKNKEYRLVGALASNQVICNIDFFERTANNMVKFLGETGTYNLYYNVYRKFLLITPDNPSYPNYLLLTGTEIGYPSTINTISKGHTSWGFDNVMKYILFRKTADNVFQGTLYIGAGAGFKPFENSGWANEKKLGSFTSIIGEQILKGDNDWQANDLVDTNAYYQITIDLNTKTVNIKKITL